MFINSGSLVKQELNVPFTANTTYTLAFDIADLRDNDISSYTIRFKAGTTTVYSVANPQFPVEGTFERVILSFDSDNTLYEGELLSPEIEPPTNSTTKQINLDNFELTYETEEQQQPGFGKWQHTMLGNGPALNTIYEAETDGFITFRNGGTFEGIK
jgi:hypothetical protein